MVDFIPSVLMLAFAVFCVDQKIISGLQRQGKYNPETHQTIMSRLCSSPAILIIKMLKPHKVQKVQKTVLQPTGEHSAFSLNTTICANKRGDKTRLSYFIDIDQNAWYKIEEINSQGVAIREPLFEPAIMSFNEQKLRYV